MQKVFGETSNQVKGNVSHGTTRAAVQFPILGRPERAADNVTVCKEYVLELNQDPYHPLSHFISHIKPCPTF